jgi:cytochrome c biogenesis factor
MFTKSMPVAIIAMMLGTALSLTSSSSATVQKSSIDTPKLTLNQNFPIIRRRITITKDNYAAIWHKSASTDWVARHGMTSAQYQAEFDKYVGQGYRLVQVSGYGVSGKDYYAAIWDKSASTEWVARHGMTSAQYQAEFDKYVGQGYRLVQVSGYGVNGKDYYAAIWDKSASTEWVARHGMTSAQYQAEFDKYVGQGYRLVQVSGYRVNGKDYYAAIWDKSPSGAWVARHGLTSAQYQSEFDKYVGQGYRLVQVSGY